MIRSSYHLLFLTLQTVSNILSYFHRSKNISLIAVAYLCLDLYRRIYFLSYICLGSIPHNFLGKKYFVSLRTNINYCIVIQKSGMQDSPLTSSSTTSQFNPLSPLEQHEVEVKFFISNAK